MKNDVNDGDISSASATIRLTLCYANPSDLFTYVNGQLTITMLSFINRNVNGKYNEYEMSIIHWYPSLKGC